MDRRKLSRLTALGCAAPLFTLGGCGGGDGGAATADAGVKTALGAQAGDGSRKVALWHATPNETGLRLGFWEVKDKQPYTLDFAGRRPSSRVGFDAWARIEGEVDGDYQFPEVDIYARSHRYRETILDAVNVSTAIAGKYLNRPEPLEPLKPLEAIQVPTVRQAALDFVSAYVTWLMNNFSSAVLTIDYEVISNHGLARAGSEEDVQVWAAWYVEAAEVARQAAAALNSTATLKLQPVFNGNVFGDENLLVLLCH
jgi:hypothetical protein